MCDAFFTQIPVYGHNPRLHGDESPHRSTHRLYNRIFGIFLTKTKKNPQSAL